MPNSELTLNLQDSLDPSFDRRTCGECLLARRSDTGDLICFATPPYPGPATGVHRIGGRPVQTSVATYPAVHDHQPACGYLIIADEEAS